MAVAKKLNEERQAEIKQALAELFGGKQPANDAADLEAVKQLRTEQARQEKEQHYWIELVKLQDDKEGAVFVAAAGVPYLLPKGVRMPVPISVIQCLRSARIESRIPVIGAQPGTTRIQRYDRYPFSEFGPASAEDVKKFKADQKKKENVIVDEKAEEEVIGRPEIEFSDAQMTSVGGDE